MQNSRRWFLSTLRDSALVALGLFFATRSTVSVAAESRPTFAATSLPDALKALGMADAKESNEIKLKAPDIAENGAAVPVEVQSNLPNTREISILIEKNQHVASAR